jgi:hypothetical protein
MKKISVYLFFPPFYRDYATLIRNHVDKLKNKLSLAFNDKAHIIDCSALIPDTKYFTDLTHMNYSGTRYLLEKMIEDRIFD